MLRHMLAAYPSAPIHPPTHGDDGPGARCHHVMYGGGVVTSLLFPDSGERPSWRRREEVDGQNVDPITTALQLGFFVLFGVSVFQFWRHRGPLELSVLAVFGSFAALFVLTFLTSLLPGLSQVARPPLVALLFAQPYLVVRLLNQIRPVAATVKRLTILGAVAASAAVVLLPALPTNLSVPLLQPFAALPATF